MTTKVAAILMYWLGPVGILIAYLVNKELWADEGFKQHLNQAIICFIGACLIITSLPAFVFAVWGIIKAIQDDNSPLPLIGNWKLIK